MSTFARMRWQRRSDIVNLTMTEIMILMVFVSMAFSFLARDEGLKDTDVLRAQLERAQREQLRLEGENLTLAVRISALEKELTDKNRLLARLLNQDAATLSAVVPVPKAVFERMNAELDSAHKIVDAQQRSLGDLTRKLKEDGKPTGFPRCTITSSFLMDIKLLADGGYSVQPAWEPGADTMARGLPGVAPVLARSHLTAAEFRGMAQQLHDWGDRQEVPCRFHVQVARGDTTDLDTFIRQMAVIDEFFYPKRPK